MDEPLSVPPCRGEAVERLSPERTVELSSGGELVVADEHSTYW
jgi:hypothetical protein